jgi:hypothetical protein
VDPGYKRRGSTHERKQARWRFRLIDGLHDALRSVPALRSIRDRGEAQLEPERLQKPIQGVLCGVVAWIELSIPRRVVVALLTNLGEAPWKIADVESIAEPFAGQ